MYRGEIVKNGTAAQGGHALGLPIIKQIADLLGAQIHAQTRDPV